MELPEKLEDLTQEQKEKLAEIGFIYMKSIDKAIDYSKQEIMSVRQELMSARQTTNIQGYFKQITY